VRARARNDLAFQGHGKVKRQGLAARRSKSASALQLAGTWLEFRVCACAGFWHVQGRITQCSSEARPRRRWAASGGDGKGSCRQRWYMIPNNQQISNIQAICSDKGMIPKKLRET